MARWRREAIARSAIRHGNHTTGLGINRRRDPVDRSCCSPPGGIDLDLEGAVRRTVVCQRPGVEAARREKRFLFGGLPARMLDPSR